MNLMKKRGRPTNANIAARETAKPAIEGADPQAPNSVPHINGYVEMRISAPVEMAQSHVDAGAAILAKSIDRAVLAGCDGTRERAQTYALRVWSGQAIDIKREERIARCERALQAQGLPTEGVKYPGGDDDEEWTEEDSAPVGWRPRSEGRE